MAQLIVEVREGRSWIEAMTAHLARPDRTRAVRLARVEWRVVLNLVMVLALVGAAVALLDRVGEQDADAFPAAVLLVTSLVVSGGGAAGLMMVFAARLTGDSQVMWIGVTLGWYSLLAIPISVVRGFEPEHQSLAAGLVLVSAGAVVLWMLLVVAPVPPGATRLLVGLVSAVALVLAGTTVWAALAPSLAEVVADSPWWWLASALVWIIGGLVVVARAIVDRVRGLRVVGAGLAMLGATQVGAFVLTPAGTEAAPLLAGMRVVAIAVVLWGSLRLLRRALLRLNIAQASQEEELRRAGQRLARATVRDHDLRNGLAGLAGATAVLGAGAGTGQLSRVVAGELHRLDVMLTEPAEDDPGEARRTYAVAPVLDGLVVLRRNAGMEVSADVEPDLCADGSPGVLAQVVTNLLANAERHAPGSPVRIAAVQRSGRVEVRVRDFGPGVAAGRERIVLEPGERDERAGGMGLGLHICRTLLTAEGATIEILPSTARSPGCVVVLGLPAGEQAEPERPRRERGASCAAS